MAPKSSARDLRGYNKKTHVWDWEIGKIRRYVSCASLGLPESEWTQEKSRAAAWARYQQLVAETLVKADEQHPHAADLATWKKRATVAAVLGTPDKDYLNGAVNFLREHVPPDGVMVDPIAAERIELALKLGLDLTVLENLEDLNRLFGSDAYRDREQLVGKIDLSKTIGEAVKKWLAVKRKDVALGTRTPKGWDNIRRFLGEFTEQFGEDSPFDVITFSNWESWQALCKSNRSEHWRSTYNYSKAFVEWCWKADLLEQLPKNFRDKIEFEFDKPVINTYTDKEVVRILNLATGNLKLCLLLMLNCGMQSKDIGDLKKSEIDWKRKTITRKRSKTRFKSSTPLVTYPLWRTTLETMKECRNQDVGCEVAFTTKSGARWNWSELGGDDKLHRSDNVNSLWQNLAKQHGRIGKLGTFKKSSATKVRNEPRHSNCETVFLGHSERTMSGQRYAPVTPERLAEAVKWLGSEWKQM